MKITKLARREAKSLFRSCLRDGVLEEGRVREAVGQVVARKPRGYLAVLTHFQRLVRLDVGRRSAVVESAVALEPALQASVQAGLTKRYGASVSVRYAQNPALIAGLRIKVGSDVFDGSLQSRLNALKEKA